MKTMKELIEAAGLGEETRPCSRCGTTSNDRHACPFCDKVFCQPCAETPYEFCCDGEPQ